MANLKEKVDSPSESRQESLPNITSRPSPNPSSAENPVLKKKEDLSWFYQPQFNRPLSLSDPGFDKFLLERSELRDHSNPWGEETWKILQVSESFVSKVHPLKNPNRVIAFKLKLRRRDLATHVVPQWIKFVGRVPSETKVDYDDFFSKFSTNEVYVGLLAFPYDSFWQQIDPESQCEEIALIYDLIYSHGSKPYLTGFDGRVYCRNGLKNLKGLAHFSGERSD